jgi:hypothetical protein
MIIKRQQVTRIARKFTDARTLSPRLGRKAKRFGMKRFRQWLRMVEYFIHGD